MRVAELTPPVQFDASFDLYALNRMADCSGCYCLTNASGDILYAGQAASVKRRVVEHFNGPKKQALTVFGRISRVWWRPESLRKLNALERGWLESIRLQDGELPPLNQSSAPI
jgi:predicted GIY-YIG superfamily endonuclease